MSDNPSSRKRTTALRPSDVWDIFQSDVLGLVICEAPNRSRRSPRPVRLEIEQLEKRWLMSSGVTEYSTSGFFPGRLTMDNSGSIWSTCSDPQPPLPRYDIAKFTRGGSPAITTYTLSADSQTVTDIAWGSDNYLWAITNTGKIDKIDPNSGGSTLNVITSYPLGSNYYGRRIVPGAGHTLWIAEGNYSNQTQEEIVKVSTDGGYTAYPLLPANYQRAVTDMAVGPDGNLWLAESAAQEIGRLTPSGALTEWPVSGTPQAIAAGPDGALWFTETVVTWAYVGRITLNGLVSEFSPGQYYPSFNSIALGSDGNLWFTEGTNAVHASSVGFITPQGLYSSVATDLPWTYSIIPGPGNVLWFSSPYNNLQAGNVCKLAWIGNAREVGTDPVQGTRITVGADGLDPSNGNLQVNAPLDFSLTGATCGCRQPALVYNSDTVAALPIIQVALASDPQGPVPTSIDVALTWNGNTQPTVNFSAMGHGNGDVYLMDVQAATIPLQTGLVFWSVAVTARFSNDTISRTFPGVNPVIVNANITTVVMDPFGSGWSLAGDDTIIPGPVTALVSASGGWRLFLNGTVPGTFAPPPNDFGTLTTLSNGSYVYTAEDQTRWSFGTLYRSSMLLDSITDPHTLVTAFTHDHTTGRLMSIAEPDGGLVTFLYDTNGYLRTIVEPTDPGEPQPVNRLVTLGYSNETQNTDLTSIETPDLNLRTFAYDPTTQLLTNDQWGSLNAAIAYTPGTDVVTTVNDSGGTIYTLSPSAIQGLVTSPTYTPTLGSPTSSVAALLTDPLNHTTTYGLDTLGRWTLEQNRVATMTRALDFAGNPVIETDALNNVTTNLYQYGLQDTTQQFALGDLAQVTKPDGGITSYLYDNLYHQVTQTTDPLGHITKYAYDGQGDLLTMTNALGQVTTTIYSNGLLQTTTDPRGNTTTNEYCAAVSQTCPSTRLLQDVKDAYGHIIASYTYDQYGNVYTTTDALGHVTTTNYDLLRRLTSEQFPDGSNVAYTYNAQGQVLTKTDQLGTVTSTAYDIHGWPTTVTEAVGISGLQRSTVTAYDLAGNVLSVTDPRGTITSYGYDAGNRQITLVQDYGDSTHFNHVTTTAYDAAGNVLSVTDPRHITTAYLYDVMNRQVSVTEAQGKAEARTTTMLYDLNGNLLSQTDGNGVITSYGYDALNRQATVIRDYGSPSSHFNYLTTTAYDAAGNVLLVSHTVTLATGQAPTTLVTSYGYDLDNRQTTVTEAVGISGLQRTTVTVYDLQGNVLSVTNPLGNVTSYGYDVMNRRNETIDGYGTSLARTATTIYDLAGNVLSTTEFQSSILVNYANPLTTSYSYDKLNRLKYTIIGYGAGGPQQAQRINVYDADNNVIDSSEVWTTGNVFTTYVYDALNRKVQMIEAGGRPPAEVAPLNHAPPITTWSYDADGNLIATTDPLGDITTNAYDALNRLVSTMDARGGITTMTYDANDNLLSLTDPVNNTALYLYDALNRKVKVTDATNNPHNFTTFTYDADNLVMSTTDRDQRRIDYAYDALERLTTAVWYSAPPNVNPVNTLVYSYDADDNLLNAQDAHSLYTMTYDVLNRLATEQEPFGMGLTFTYDAAGNRTLVQDYTGTTLLGTTTSVYDRLGGTHEPAVHRAEPGAGADRPDVQHGRPRDVRDALRRPDDPDAGGLYFDGVRRPEAAGLPPAPERQRHRPGELHLYL